MIDPPNFRQLFPSSSSSSCVIDPQLSMIQLFRHIKSLRRQRTTPWILPKMGRVAHVDNMACIGSGNSRDQSARSDRRHDTCHTERRSDWCFDWFWFSFLFRLMLAAFTTIINVLIASLLKQDDDKGYARDTPLRQAAVKGRPCWRRFWEPSRR